MPERIDPKRIEAAKSIKIQMLEILRKVSTLDFPFIDPAKKYTKKDENELYARAEEHLRAYNDLIFEDFLVKLVDLLGFKNGTFQLFDLLDNYEKHGIPPPVAEYYLEKLQLLINMYENGDGGEDEHDKR